MVYNINQVSFRQAITPPRMQGRMNASMRFIVWGTIPPGQILGGVIGATLGLSAAIWVGAIGSCAAFLFVLFSPVRSLRAMPEPVEDDSGPGRRPSGATLVGEALDEMSEAVGASAPLVRAEDAD